MPVGPSFGHIVRRVRCSTDGWAPLGRPQSSRRASRDLARASTVSGVPTRNYDERRIAELLRREVDVVTHAELEALGMPRSTASYRVRPEGPWRPLLPGVVLARRGTPTHYQRGLAALKYAGPEAVLTGRSALARHGLGAAAAQEHVLISHRRSRASRDFVLVERTTRMPPAVARRGLACAPVPRALVDACRRLQSMDEVRELVAQAVQSRACGLSDFGEAVLAGARGQSALSRRVLAEMSAGVRSVAEAKARQILRRLRIPPPEWNVDVLTASGTWLGCVDAYWPAGAAALEIDSMAWHLSPSRYRRTQARQRAFVVAGVLVLPIAPADVVDRPERFAEDVRGLLAEAARRPVPSLRVRRRS